MVKTQLILLVSLLCLLPGVRSASPPTICSTFCGTNGCTGWTMTDCTSSCYSGWSFSATMGTCDFATTSNNAVMAFSDDAGGDISMDIDPGTGCNCSGNTFYYGNYKASDTVTASLSMGTYDSHYAFDIYFNLVLVDGNSGGAKWDSSLSMDVILVNATNTTLNQKLTQNIKTSTGGGGPVSSSNSYCGSGSSTDYFYRMVYKTYTHNETGSPIDVTLKINGNSNSNAIWNLREVIFVAYKCNVYCLTCFNKLITQCWSCDANAGYMLSKTTCATSCLTGYGPTSDPSLCVLCSTLCSACF